MDEYTLTADVYKVDDAISGMNHNFLWDFGTFTCEGTETTPVKLSHLYGHVVLEQDVDWLDGQEPTKTDITLYEWDYGIYVPLPDEFEETLSSDIRYFIEGAPYELQRRLELSSENGVNKCVLLVRRGDEKLVTQDEFNTKLGEGEWVRALLLQ